MKPDYLVISGWGPYKERVEIDFTKLQKTGLFLITGSTGAGKTTIFDAITYALYGTLSGETREKGSVRSDFAQGEVATFVELTMTHGGKEYRIYRNPEYLRPKKKKSGGSELTKEKENAILYLPDGKVLEGMKEVNAAMQDILVLAPEQFKQISMIAQGQFSKLLTAPAKDKIGIFREIFGTGIYERFAKNLRERSNTLYSRATEQKHKIEEDVRLLLDSKTDVISPFQTRLQELTEVDNWNYEAIEACLLDWRAELKQALQENEKQYLEADKKTLELTEKLTVLQEQNKKVRQWQQACERQTDLLGQSEKYDQIREKIQNAEAALSVQSKETALLALVNQAEKNNTRYLNLQAEIEQLQKEKSALQRYYEHREALEEYFQILDRGQTLGEELRNCNAQWEMAGKSHRLAGEEYLALEKERDAFKAEYDRAEKQYKHGVIGLAAEMLLPGEPCPVCGSLEHPSPAKLSRPALTEEELRLQKETLEEKEKQLSEKQEKMLLLFAKLQSLTEQKEMLEAQQREINKNCEEKGAFLTARGLKQEGMTATKVRAMVTDYDRILGLLQSKEEEKDSAAFEGENLKTQVREARETFLAELETCGFAEEEEFRLAVIEKEEKRILESRLQAYREEVAVTESRIRHLEQELASVCKEGERVPELQDEEKPRETLELAKQEKEAARLKQEKVRSLLDRLKSTLASMKEKREKLEQISLQYGYVKDLDNLASGNNKKRMVFEQYVLTGYFDRILQAANLRFSYMTGGRYEMSRVEEIADGRTKNSLEIEVMDYYTGKTRSVKTLSGGESFKASLALALGLSDVIQAMNGGIKVDALFVDEGFGALDSESLDQACETLQGLVERDRMIGIISHVQELRERIDHQIVVERSNQGSRVKTVLF